MAEWGGVRGKVHKGHKETFGGDGYVQYPDFSAGFMSIHMCQNLQNCPFKICSIYCTLIISQ